MARTSRVALALLIYLLQPLWNRRQDHGVITVYAGSEKRLTIEQDRMPMGATAIFKGLLDLVIVGYGESGI
jgi:hypothetical protein